MATWRSAANERVTTTRGRRTERRPIRSNAKECSTAPAGDESVGKTGLNPSIHRRVRIDEILQVSPVNRLDAPAGGPDHRATVFDPTDPCPKAPERECTMRLSIHVSILMVGMANAASAA